jgi:hypothetical protein
MTRISFSGGELVSSLLRRLSQAVDVRRHSVSAKILGNDRSLLPRLGSDDEGRLRPVLIPMRSGGRDKERSCLLQVVAVSTANR